MKLRASIGDLGRRLWALPGRWPRMLIGAACLTVLAMYCGNRDMGGDPTSPRGDGKYRPVLARGDGHMEYLIARSTALDGDWDFANDLARFGDPWNAPIGPTGRKLIGNPLGPPLVWTPLIWIAEAGAAIVDLFGADIQLHGYTLWHQRFVFLSSVLFACGAVLLGRKVARKAIGGSWSSAYAAAAVLLGTSLTYYATFMPSYGHAMDAGVCAAFLGYWALTIGRTDRRRLIVLGALLGLAMLIRTQDIGIGIAFLAEAIAAMVAARSLRTCGAWIARGAAVLAITFVVFTPQLLFWHVVYGSTFTMPQGTMYMRPSSPMILEILFSARNGFFTATPVAYAGVIGLFCLPRRSRLIAIGLLGAVAIQVYLNSTVMDYWGSAAFGQRRLCTVTLPLVVGLAALLWRMQNLARRFRVPRWACHAFAAVVFGSFIAWNLMRVSELHAGHAPNEQFSSACCDRVPAPLRGVARAIYDTIGDPFEFPANALFAIRHHTSLQRWDQVVGNYPLVPNVATFLDGTIWNVPASWHIEAAGSEPYLLGGWSGPQVGDRKFRWTIEPVARALVPNLNPWGQRVTVWLAPGGAKSADVRWDHRDPVHVDLGPGWTPVAIDVPEMTSGEHELAIEAEPASFAGGNRLPVPTQPVGVAVGAIDLKFLRP